MFINVVLCKCMLPHRTEFPGFYCSHQRVAASCVGLDTLSLGVQNRRELAGPSKAPNHVCVLVLTKAF